MGMRNPLITAATAMAALALVAGACGDDANDTEAGDGSTTTTVNTEPTAPSESTTTAPATPEPITSASDDDPIVGCPSGPTFPLSALDDAVALAAPANDVAAAMQTFLENEEGAFWPQDGWRVLHATDEQVLVVHVGDRSTAAEAGLSFMTLEHDGDAWQWAGASGRGDCPLQFQLDEGLGIVGWRLDPDHPEPGPTDTTVHVLANESDCASGQAMGDRLNEPVVLADASQISITFSVTPPEGDQNCPSNPNTAVEVDLGEPLGDRRLVDGREVGVELEDLLTDS